MNVSSTSARPGGHRRHPRDHIALQALPTFAKIQFLIVNAATPDAILATVAASVAPTLASTHTSLWHSLCLRLHAYA